MIENWKRARSRSRVVAALAVGLTLFTSTPAWAGGKAKADWGTIQLSNVGDEPCASGQATLTNVERTWYCYDEYPPGSPWPILHVWAQYTGVLTVACQNLNPRATYWTPAGTFRAGRTGTGTVKGKVSFEIVYIHDTWTGSTTLLKWFVVDVIRLDADGSETTVLTGDFFPPWHASP